MHDIKSDSGQKTAMGIGFFVSTVMLAASGYFNAIYGYRLGQTPMDGAVFAVIGVAFEVFLALMPFFFVSALRGRAWGSGLFLLAVWLILIGVSANAAIGHIAGSRLAAMSNRIAATTTYQDDRKELKRLEDRLSWLPQPSEAEGALRAKIKAQQSLPIWTQTAECANQWNTTAKTFCAKVTELTSALNNTLEYEVTLVKIAKIKDKLGQQVAQHVGVLSEGADAQASLYSKALGVDPTTVAGVLSGIFAAAILMIASMGFYISVAPIRAAQRVARDLATPANASSSLTLTTEDGKMLDITPAPNLPQKQLLLPKNAQEISPEAKALLYAMGIPRTPCDKRPKDTREVLGIRFFAWVTLCGYSGEHPQDTIDDLYAAFALADYRQPWEGMRVVKAELSALGKRFVQSGPKTMEDGTRPTYWQIKPVSIPRLTIMLEKAGAISKDLPPTPEPQPDDPPAAPKNVFRLFGRGSDDEAKKVTG